MRHDGRMNPRKHHILKDYAELMEDGQPIVTSVKMSDKFRENYSKIDWGKDDTRSAAGTSRAVFDSEDSKKGMEGRTLNCS